MSSNRRLRVFVSFHHSLNQGHYEKLRKVITELGHIDISVNRGNLIENEDQKTDEQIREEIRRKHLINVNVTVVIVGQESINRKHIDWETRSTFYKYENSREGGIVVINALNDPAAMLPGGIPFTWILDSELIQLHDENLDFHMKPREWPQKISNEELKWLPSRLANSITKQYSYNSSKRGVHKHAVFPIISYSRALDKRVMKRAILHAYESISSNKGKWDLGSMRRRNNCSPDRLVFKQVAP